MESQSSIHVGAVTTEYIHLEEKTDTDSTGSALPIGSEKGLVDVPLDASKESSKKNKNRVPRRVLHFSDGTLEEYSTDEEEEKKEEPQVDPKSLTWLPWFWYYIVKSSLKVLSTADACGEKIAWMLGITSPKYQYILDEYHRRKEEELMEQMEAERLVNAKKEPEVVVHEPEMDRNKDPQDCRDGKERERI